MNKITLLKRGANHFLPAANSPNEPGEPVFLLRGQDELAGATVLYWAALVESRGLDQVMLQSARDHAVSMVKWPVKKLPDIRPVAQPATGFEYSGLDAVFEPFTFQGVVTAVDHENGLVNVIINEKPACLTMIAWTELIERGMIRIR
jgi:hypothetical protein